MKRLFQITLDNLASPEQQNLAIKVGERHCSFAITDVQGERLYHLAYYTSEEMDEGSLINLFASHPELNKSFNKVVIGYDNPYSVLIPSTYFKSEDVALLLKTTFGINGQQIINTEALSEWQMHNAFAVSKPTLEWFNKKYPSAECHHIHTIGVRNIKDAGNGGKCWIDFRTDEFTVIVAKENKLLLAQSYVYASPGDVLYYLLKITQQFSLSQKEVVLILSGLIEKDSALYKELYNYFLNLEFRNAKWDLTENIEYPAHFFTSLNDLAVCGL